MSNFVETENLHKIRCFWKQEANQEYVFDDFLKGAPEDIGELEISTIGPNFGDLISCNISLKIKKFKIFPQIEHYLKFIKQTLFEQQILQIREFVQINIHKAFNLSDLQLIAVKGDYEIYRDDSAQLVLINTSESPPFLKAFNSTKEILIYLKDHLE